MVTATCVGSIKLKMREFKRPTCGTRKMAKKDTSGGIKLIFVQKVMTRRKAKWPQKEDDRLDQRREETKQSLNCPEECNGE